MYGSRLVKIAVVGAGRTGRGFIGRLLAERGLPFVLFDRDESLVSRLSLAGGYSVHFFGESRPEVAVAARAYLPAAALPSDELIRSLDFLFVSVGATNLSEAARFVGELVGRRRFLTEERCAVILCENAPDASRLFLPTFVEASGAGRTGPDARADVVNAAVFCTTTLPSAESLDILSEDYPRLECGTVQASDRLGFLAPTAHMGLLMERKLYTYNALSALLSYAGWWKGYALLSQAADDPQIALRAERYRREIDAAIVGAMGIDPEEQARFSRKAIEKFANPEIADPISRNIRNAERKLARGERIIGPLLLVRKVAGDEKTLAETAALMLLFAAVEEGQVVGGRIDALVGRLCTLSGLAVEDPFVEAVGTRLAPLSKRSPNGRLPAS